MLPVIQFVVYFFILPIIYILMMLFDFNLVRRAESQTQRLRMLFGVVAGVLVAVIVMLLDQTTNLFRISTLPDPTKIDQVGPYVGIAFLVGLLLMLLIHLLLKAQQVLSFIVMFTILAMVVSLYFLLTMSDIRSIVAVSSLGFLVGIIIYFMLVPSIVPLLIAGVPAQQPEHSQKPDWS